MNSMYNARVFGATGTAVETETLKLTVPGYKWIQYPPDTTAVIRHAPLGMPLDSVGIQRAIDAAHDAGGGTVLVPPGDYLIGPIVLRSHVELHLASGARLWASPKLEDYAVQQNLLLAENAEDIALSGRGEIHGQSPNWVIPWLNEGPADWASLNSRRPGKMLMFLNCRHVAVDKVRIFDSPNWTLVFQGCRHVAVRGIFIHHFDAINADGIDVVDSQDVTISDCSLHVTDDGICLKNDASNPNPAGVRNVVVTNCIIRTWCNGVKIGTESNGLFEDIAFSNIVIHNPDDDLKGAEGGINICCCDGGQTRNVSFRGIVMRNVECPFYLVTTPRRRFQQAYRAPRSGMIERVAISDVQADGFRYTPFVVGAPGAPIRNITLTAICIRKTAEFRAGPFPQAVPACDQQYPTPLMFGSPDGGRRDCGDGLSAYGLYLRDAQQVSVRGFSVTCTQADGRVCVAHESCSEVNLG